MGRAQWLKRKSLAASLLVGLAVAVGLVSRGGEAQRLRVRLIDGKLHLTARAIPLRQAIGAIEQAAGLVVKLPPGFDGAVSAAFEGVSAEQAVTRLVRKIDADSKLAFQYRIDAESGTARIETITVARSHAEAGAPGDEPAVGLVRPWRWLEKMPAAKAGWKPWIRPQRFRAVSLDLAKMRQLLARAPLEFSAEAKRRPVEIRLPMPTGKLARFHFTESPIMEPALAKKFPALKTYKGYGIDDTTASVRFDLTPAGFHAQVLSPSGRSYIDPYWQGNTKYYSSYYSRDLGPPDEAWSCLTDPELHTWQTSARLGAAATTSDGKLRVYRVAVAAQGQYTQFHGGTVNDGLAAITTTVNRVTGILEQDLGIRITLVGDNDQIIYTNSSTDPFTGNTADLTVLSQNQTNTDSVIGSSNYDFGHVFNTGGGGLAYVGVICVSNWKARGASGLSSPQGDAFDVDYVAHEMGHQFSATHTFNGSLGACGGSRSSSTAYEVGSGSTIMAYAGICGSDDLQPHTDPYYHFASLDQIYDHVTNDATCANVVATGNSPPSVDAGSDYTIPAQTPFRLTATGSDTDNDTLTYTWEEADLGPQATLSTTDDGSIPLFRSFDPTTTRYRNLPRLADILNNTTSTGEQYPTTDRTMAFRVTARDNRGGIDMDSAQITVDGDAGPFEVNVANTPVSWNSGSVQTITWKVASTSAAPVSVSQVRIQMSVDGGNTFPYVLASPTANDGSHEVTLPAVATTQGRIKVAAVGNIFFDICNADITLVSSFSATGTKTIADSAGNGNDNGAVDPGESSVGLTFEIRNEMASTATNIAGVLTSQTGTATIVDGNAAYADLAANGTGSNTSAFIINVDPSHPCGAAIFLTLSITSDIGGTDLAIILGTGRVVGDADPICDSVVVDNTPPDVTVEQGAAQADPATGLPINFDVVFTETVFNLAAGDFSLGGTASPSAATLTGSGSVYQLAVTTVAGNGTVTVSLPADSAEDGVGNPNTQSTSTDNSVTLATGATVAFQANNSATADEQAAAHSVTVVLSAPNGAIPGAVGATVSDSGGGSASSGTDYQALGPQTVTFTSGSTNGATQTVDLNVLADFAAEGDETVVLQLGSVTGPASAGATTGHTATITDDDADVIVVSSGAVDVTEGAINTYTVSLGAIPPGAVQVSIDPGNGADADLAVSLAAATLTLDFDQGNWNQEQTVTITAQEDDDAANGSTDFVHTAAGYPNVTVTATETDNDTLEIVLNPTSRAVPEGDSAEYEVSLGAAPPGDVTVAIAPAQGSDADLTIDKNSLDFTTGDWNQPQTVTVSAAQDADAVEDTADFVHTAQGLPNATFIATEDDDELTYQFTFQVAPTTFAETAGSSAAEATVLTNDDRGGEITVTILNSAPTRLTAPAQVVIPAGQTGTQFTIGAIDNAVAEGNSAVTITIQAADHDDGVKVLTVTDDDVATLTVSLDPATVSEGDGAAASGGTVTRNTDNSALLTVNLASDKEDEATVPAQVVIPAQANSATFDIDAVDDLLLDGAQTVAVSATAAGHAPGSADLSVTDDEVPVVYRRTYDKTRIGDSAIKVRRRHAYLIFGTTGADLNLLQVIEFWRSGVRKLYRLVDADQFDFHYSIAGVGQTRSAIFLFRDDVAGERGARLASGPISTADVTGALSLDLALKLGGLMVEWDDVDPQVIERGTINYRLNLGKMRVAVQQGMTAAELTDFILTNGLRNYSAAP